MVDQGIATRILNDFLFVITGGMARGLPAALSLMKHLIVIELVVASVYLGVGQRHAGISMMSKLLWIGLLTFFLQNWGALTTAFMQSLVQHGLTVGGGALTVQEFLDPGKIMRIGLEIIGVIFTRLTSYTGMAALYNLPTTIIMGFAAIGIWFCFFILAREVFLKIIFFYLAVAQTLILLPFGALRYTSFLAEKSFAIVISTGVTLSILAVIASVALPFLVTLQIDPNPTFGEAFTLLGAAGLIASLAWHANDIANGIMTGTPVFGAANEAALASSSAQLLSSTAGGIAHAASVSRGATDRAVSAMAATRAATATRTPPSSGRT